MVIWACAHMVARESFGSAVFVGEEGGGGAAYGNNKEEQDDIEEELQVSMLSQEPTSNKVEKKTAVFSMRMHSKWCSASVVRPFTSATVDYSSSCRRTLSSLASTHQASAVWWKFTWV